MLQAAQTGLDVESLSLLTAVLLLLALILLLGTLAWFMLGARAMDVQFVMRLGAPTGLRRAGFRAAFLAAMAALAGTLAWMASPGFALVGRLAIVACAAAAAATVAHFAWLHLSAASSRQQEQAALRQRQAADAFHVLRSTFDRAALLEAAARQIASVLDIHPIIIFLERDGQFRAHHALGDSLASDLIFSAGAPLVQHLARPSSGATITLGPIVEDSSTFHFASAHALAETEFARLAGLGLSLIVPLRLELRLAGFLALGPRAGRLPYSIQDLRFLERVASEFAACLEWSGTVSAFAAVQAELGREQGEQEFRRAAKHRLFDGDAGLIPAFEYAGACSATGSPTLEIYSFLPLPENGLGVLLASARGDGPEWALAIAELRGWVRGRSDLGTNELQRELERRRQSGGAILLRLFYARLELRTQQLHYVNAGYPAPFVLRRTYEGAQVLRLSPGAGEPGSPVMAGAFSLLPGDLVVAASSGLVKASNAAGEYWGEGRLIETLLAWESQRAPDIVQLILRTAQGYAASSSGADQAIVVLRPLKTSPAQQRS